MNQEMAFSSLAVTLGMLRYLVRDNLRLQVALRV